MKIRLAITHFGKNGFVSVPSEIVFITLQYILTIQTNPQYFDHSTLFARVFAKDSNGEVRCTKNGANLA
jgi:hypothetical protein